MATSGPDLLSELCEDLLCCDICHEDFDHDSHSPRILPCYHSFCGTCLEKLNKDGSVECPKCRRVAQVSGKFPMDTTRIALLDKKRALQSQEGVSCEGCTKGAKATLRCQDCEEFLCEDCCVAHRKVNATKNHAIISMAEAAKSPAKLQTVGEKCDRHPDERLKVFCVPCSTAVCAMCALLMHKKCEDLVELDSILDEKKKELLSVCEQLDKVEQSFQAKAEESEASLEAVQSNLSEAVQEAEAVFGEIISSATERQAEVIGELRARAKSDGLLLEEQAATFRSLQAATHTAAQYGRTCVALNLYSQVVTQNQKLHDKVRELRERTTTPVRQVPEYRLMTNKLDHLKALMKQIGEADSIDVQSFSASLPSIQLDSSRCGAGCRVGADRCSLSNQPCPPSPSQPQTQQFRFQGTCAIEMLTGARSYWQVRCAATPAPHIKDMSCLCEFGVATQQALQACPGGCRSLSETVHCALTVRLLCHQGRVSATAQYRNWSLFEATLAHSTPDRPVDVTLGLLLDTATSRLHVIDVRATRVLCASDIDLSTPVWPVVRVWPAEETGAGVEVEVQSGQQIWMTRDLVQLLQVPPIQLDTSRCGSGCWVGEGGCSLIGQPSARLYDRPNYRIFRFAGTCGSQPLPGTASYIPVKCIAVPKPTIKNQVGLCELGVAVKMAMRSHPGDDRWISDTGSCAFSVLVYTQAAQVRARAQYRNRIFPHTALASFHSNSSVDLTLGLLLDTATSRLHLIDVGATRVLWSSDIDLSTPLWPVVRVWPEDHNGASVSLEILSGQRNVMTEELVGLLHSLLGRHPQESGYGLPVDWEVQNDQRIEKLTEVLDLGCSPCWEEPVR